MGYDVWFKADLGGDDPITVGRNDINYTYNCGQMFATALSSVGTDMKLSDLSGRKCGDCIGLLTDAINHMHANHKTYTAMNPRNGWGDYVDATDFLKDILDECICMPNATIWVS